ncbi:MAG: signal peptidase [Frankiales bacterium]|nr:signal peptidase [Frankiales bacterium]
MSDEPQHEPQPAHEPQPEPGRKSQSEPGRESQLEREPEADREPSPAPVADEAEPKSRRSFVRELPFLVVLALLLTLGLRYFVVQAFYIPSNSMERTLMVGDRVLVNKVPYLYRDPHRGEIVVFNGLDNFDEGVTFAQPTSPVGKLLHKISSTIGLGAPDEKDYIKRVIGVAGDRVMCCDAQGRVVVTPKGGKPAPLDEPYIFENDTSGVRYFCEAVVTVQPRTAPGAQACPPGAQGILVPKGRLWVMGDHRADSADSRYHLNDPNQGTVPVSKVIGRAAAVVYPLGHWRTLRVPKTFAGVALPATPPLLGLAAALPVTVLRRRRLLRRA